MLHSIYAITVKELRVFLKDLGSLFTLFVMPLAFIVIFSLALSNVYGPPEDHPIAIPISVDGAGELVVVPNPSPSNSSSIPPQPCKS
jgi:hypothetical protein